MLILEKSIQTKWQIKTMEQQKQPAQFLTKSEFGRLIEKTVKSHKSSYMDAIIWLCDKNDVDLEDVKKFISPIIKTKLEAEAMNLNYLPRQNSLPFE
ncbi:MAG TPA: hypothetical protein DCW83_02140 [Saprospirales bacterium]|nr:hypothetical protein [Saprospirales bacterium]